MQQALERLAERLRDLRAARSWTQREAAERAGITSQYLSILERAAPSRHGKPMMPKPGILRRLAGAYAIPYADLASIVGYIDKDLDPVCAEAEQILEDIKRNPDIRVIHKTIRNMTPAQLKAWVNVMRTLVPSTRQDGPSPKEEEPGKAQK